MNDQLRVDIFWMFTRNGILQSLLDLNHPPNHPLIKDDNPGSSKGSARYSMSFLTLETHISFDGGNFPFATSPKTRKLANCISLCSPFFWLWKNETLRIFWHALLLGLPWQHPGGHYVPPRTTVYRCDGPRHWPSESQGLEKQKWSKKMVNKTRNTNHPKLTFWGKFFRGIC